MIDLLLHNLRTIGTHHCDGTVGEEAADEIERLRAEVAGLRERLKVLEDALAEVLEFQSAPTQPTIHDWGRWRRALHARDQEIVRCVLEAAAKAFEAEVDTWDEMKKRGYSGAIRRKGANAILALEFHHE